MKENARCARQFSFIMAKLRFSNSLSLPPSPAQQFQGRQFDQFGQPFLGQFPPAARRLAKAFVLLLG